MGITKDLTKSSMQHCLKQESSSSTYYQHAHIGIAVTFKKFRISLLRKCKENSVSTLLCHVVALKRAFRVWEIQDHL